MGNYFLDVADVNGDGRADLISMNTDGNLYVFEGQSDGTFAAPKTAGSINPIFDDGIGEEPAGLGDVNGDGRADLLTLDHSDNKLRLRLGEEDGTFSAPTTPYGSTIDSSLLDGEGTEFIGLLDYNRDGRADLVALDGEGHILTYRAQLDENGAVSFASPIDHGGNVTSIRESESGVEFASEKPWLSRTGCTPAGCTWHAPPHLQAESYPATLKGSGPSELNLSEGAIKCPGSSLEGTAAEATGHLDLTAQYSGCEVLGPEGEKLLVASVKMNGCHYTLGVSNSGPPYAGTWGVACEGPGEAIEVKVTKSNYSCLKLYPQSGLGGIALANGGEGAERGIAVEAEAKGLAYEVLGSVCTHNENHEPETFADGVLEGETTLLGENGAAEAVGVYLSGGM